jgi:DnaJ-class molecular chaperone
MTDDPRDPDELAPGDEAPAGMKASGEDVCPRCVGSGMVDGEDCPECGGTGRVTKAVGGG